MCDNRVQQETFEIVPIIIRKRFLRSTSVPFPFFRAFITFWSVRKATLPMTNNVKIVGTPGTDVGKTFSPRFLSRWNFEGRWSPHGCVMMHIGTLHRRQTSRCVCQETVSVECFTKYSLSRSHPCVMPQRPTLKTNFSNRTKLLDSSS